MRTTLFEKCDALAARHGYRLRRAEEGRFVIVSRGIRGFSDDKTLPYTFRSELGAVEYLIPICGAEFSADYHRTFPEHNQQRI